MDDFFDKAIHGTGIAPEGETGFFLFLHHTRDLAEKKRQGVGKLAREKGPIREEGHVIVGSGLEDVFKKEGVKLDDVDGGIEIFLHIFLVEGEDAQLDIFWTQEMLAEPGDTMDA